MSHPWSVVTRAILIVLLVGGCRGGAQQEQLSVGTCVQVNEAGTTVVPCTDPHTHKVIAIAQRAEACPSETDMFSQPADPDEGLTTTCFQSDTATE